MSMINAELKFVFRKLLKAVCSYRRQTVVPRSGERSYAKPVLRTFDLVRLPSTECPDKEADDEKR